MMKKQIIAGLIALTCAAGFLGAMPGTANVNAASYNESEYKIELIPERTVVSASEVKDGDVVIPAAVYFVGSTANTFVQAEAAYSSDTDNITFANLITGSDKQSTEVTYDSSQGTFTTNYYPYCFGGLNTVGKTPRYTNNSPMFTTNSIYSDRATGSTVYSNGPYSITFSYSDYYHKESADASATITEQSSNIVIAKQNLGDVFANSDATFTLTLTKALGTDGDGKEIEVDGSLVGVSVNGNKTLSSSDLNQDGSYTFTADSTSFQNLPSGEYSLVENMETDGYACTLSFSKFKVGENNTLSSTSEATPKITVTCDVDENGTYSYTHINQSTGVDEDVTYTIPNYDPTIEAGTAIPGECNRVLWTTTSQEGLSSGLPFFGDTSDEFPFFEVDIVIHQGTPTGIYHIDFDTDNCLLRAAGDTASGVECPLTAGSCEIAVGVDKVDVSSCTSLNSQAAGLYASYDTHPVEASDIFTEILATVTYMDENGNLTEEDNVDITALVDMNGETPESLYDSVSGQYYYYNKNAALYYDGSPLLWEDGSAFTAKVLVGMKGDVDLNGSVDGLDARAILVYNGQYNLGTSPNLYSGSDTVMEMLVRFLGDIDTCRYDGSLDGNDAHDILVYNGQYNLGNPPSWDSFRV